MDAEAPEQLADVVADRVLREHELLGYLTRRPALGEEHQDLVLSWSELDLRLPQRGPFHDLLRTGQAEDAYDMTVVLQRRGADFDRDAGAVGTNDVDLEVGHVSAEELAGEDLPRTALVLRRDDFGEVSATHLADDSASPLR
jgi:hypothetical protein